MSICSYSFLILSSLVIAGCSTNHFDRNKQFSSSGTLYTEAVDELLKNTKKRLVTVNSEALLIAPPKTMEKRRQAILAQNTSLAKLIDQINEFSEHNQLLGRYFTELKVVSSAGESSELGFTIGVLSQTIANLNKRTIDEHGYELPLRMSPHQRSHLSQVADSMIKHHYAKKIRRQIQKDSQIIATQIFLQGKQLDTLIALMTNTIIEGNIIFGNRHVIEPYEKHDFPTDRSQQEWIKSRIHWFQQRETASVFKKVKMAQQAMLLAWMDIVKGKHDITSINNLLNDINTFTHAMNVIHVTTKRYPNSKTTP